jgi:CheY-like chemotaxis protein
MAVIVTADDDEGIRTVTARTLRRAGHTVIATADGTEALAAVRAHRPDIVVTDVDMPGMDGLRLCWALRAEHLLQHIPVLVVSVSTDLHNEQITDAGVSAVLAKPWSPAQLLHHVDDRLARQATPAVAGTAVGAACAG